MELRHARVMVVGTGRSGISATDLLVKTESEVILYNSSENTDFEEVTLQLKSAEGVEMLKGELTLEQLDSKHIDLLVLSPGVPMDAEIVKQAMELKIPVIGEVELGFMVGNGKIVAITGTNGKTTTTSLVGEILSSYYDDVRVAGNIGIPYTSVAFDSTEDTITVAEISSFQLETIHTFDPNVSAILNITPDHLNRHKTMEEYTNCKMKIAKNQDSDEPVVLNYEDPILRERAEEFNNKIVWFSSKQRVPCGVYIEDGNFVYEDGEKTVVCSIEDTCLVGVHNLENIMAAIAMAINMDVPIEKIKESVENFKPVPHRIEYVETINDVIFYNDSKGTNTDASIKAVEAMTRPTVLIAGGYDKDSSFDEWVDSFEDKIKCLVVLGQTADKIAETAKQKGFENIIKTETLEEAVEECFKNAEAGDAVLLSPACASWGMFENFEQRGDMFKELVIKLKG